MFEYELHQARHAELVREAAAERLSREAGRVARTRRASRRQEPEGRVSAAKHRFVRAA
ncbi:hypothetical protein [Streptomyces sp. NPDC127114]|uniref:hypothetical protein n=1 Tax=Streptomyces sp. NPDC127114 TaxID=3345366 RepID=UPI00362BF523